MSAPRRNDCNQNPDRPGVFPCAPDTPIVIHTLTVRLLTDGRSVRHTEPGERHSGFTDPDAHRVGIGSFVLPGHATKTLIHELAHIGRGRRRDRVRRAPRPHGYQAESVAHTVGELIRF